MNMNMNRASKELAVEVLYPTRSEFFTIFTQLTDDWSRAKEQLEKYFGEKPNYTACDIVRYVCFENKWPWREGISEDGPNVLVFAK